MAFPGTPVRKAERGHGRGVCACWELRLPQFLSSLDVETADVGVCGTGNKHDTAGSDNWAAEAYRSGRNLPWVRAAKILHGAERHLPTNFAFGHVDCR